MRGPESEGGAPSSTPQARVLPNPPVTVNRSPDGAHPDAAGRYRQDGH